MFKDRPVTLEFIAVQLQRVLTELRVLRDDVDVMAVIVRRLDNSVGRLENNHSLLLDELRAIHA
jgi:hypothetical protein